MKRKNKIPLYNAEKGRIDFSIPAIVISFLSIVVNILTIIKWTMP